MTRARHTLRRTCCNPAVRAVERELVGWGLWMALGRLLQIGFGFSRLACGLDPRQPLPPAPPNVPDFKEAKQALARSYGRSFMRDTGCCQ